MFFSWEDPTTAAVRCGSECLLCMWICVWPSTSTCSFALLPGAAAWVLFSVFLWWLIFVLTKQPKLSFIFVKSYILQGQKYLQLTQFCDLQRYSHCLDFSMLWPEFTLLRLYVIDWQKVVNNWSGRNMILVLFFCLFFWQSRKCCIYLCSGPLVQYFGVVPFHALYSASFVVSTPNLLNQKLDIFL